MKKRTKRILSITVIVISLTIIACLDLNIIQNGYLKRVLSLCAIYTIVGVSMNLVNGFTGLFSLGQAGFMAIGAYCVAIFTVPVAAREAMFYVTPMWPAIANIQLPFIVAVLIGGLLAALLAFLIGAPVLRLKGDYLAIATLGFSEIIRIVLTNMQTVTNGPLGINKVPSLGSIWWIYITAALVIIFIMLLIKSSYGRAFKAIRDDDIAAENMGVNLFKHKVLSFVISAFFTAIAGGLYATLLGTVDPKNFYFTFTYNFLLIIVLGGLGSISGTIIASFVVTAGLEWLRFLDSPVALFGWDIPLFRPGFRMVIFSVLLMIIVLFYRKGLLGTREMSWDLLVNSIKNIKAKFTRQLSIKKR